MTKSTKALTALALAGAVSAIAAMTVAPQPAAAADEEFEKCFGIWKAGANDCASAAGNSCAGTSTTDFDGRAWKLVKTGTCTSTTVDVKSADGTMTKKMGTLTEVAG